MHKYRTHNCSEITKKDSGASVKLSGWIHRKRDHGNLLFFDLRDHFGLTQCVIENTDNLFKLVLTLLSPIKEDKPLPSPLFNLIESIKLHFLRIYLD